MAAACAALPLRLSAGRVRRKVFSGASLLRRSKTVRHRSQTHVDWDFGPAVLAIFAERSKDVLEKIIRPCEREIANSLSQPHPSWYEEAAIFLSVLLSEDPTSIQRILDLISADKATLGWQACLKDRAGARRTVGLLIEAALERNDAMGRLARDLRTHFPKSSTVRPPTS
jgi:hypothetical protein